MKNTSRFFASLAVSALPIVVAAQAAPAKGLGYTTVITTDSGGRKTTMSTRLEMLGSKFSINMKSDAIAGMPIDMTTVIDSLDGTLTTIMPAQSMAMISSASIIKQQQLTAPPYTLVIDGKPTIKTEPLGAGEKILGHATRHSRMTMDYAMKFTMGDLVCVKPMREVSETWTTDEVVLPDLTDAVQRFTGVAMPVSAAKTLDSLKKAGIKGMMLKRVATSDVLGAAGETLHVTTMMEMAAMSPDSVDPKDFEVPAGLNVMDMRETMKSMDPGAMQDAMFSAQLKAADRMKLLYCAAGASGKP